MREISRGVLLALAAWLGVSATAEAQVDTLRIALEAAVERATGMSPLVFAAEGAIPAATGTRSSAMWPFPTNPTIEFERLRRGGAASTVHDYGWRFSQQIEIAGQSFLRSAAGSQRILAAEASVQNARRVSGLDARLTYVGLYLAERRSAVADSNAVLAEQLAELARRQLDAGEINKLEYNTAALEAARARSQADRLEGDSRSAAADLGRLLALPADSTVTTQLLPPLPQLGLDVGRLRATALDRRADMRAARLELEAAEKVLSANSRGWVPNLELALLAGQEAATDDLFGFSIGLTVPLFHRGQSEVGSARADRSLAVSVVTATQRSIAAGVEAGAARYATALASERRFATDLLFAGSENAELATRAFQEGELSIAEVVVYRSTALATRLEYLDVLADAYSAWFELAAALNARPEELIDLLGGGR